MFFAHRKISGITRRKLPCKRSRHKSSFGIIQLSCRYEKIALSSLERPVPFQFLRCQICSIQGADRLFLRDGKLNISAVSIRYEQGFFQLWHHKWFGIRIPPITDLISIGSWHILVKTSKHIYAFPINSFLISHALIADFKYADIPFRFSAVPILHKKFAFLKDRLILLTVRSSFVRRIDSRKLRISKTKTRSRHNAIRDMILLHHRLLCQ